MSDRGGWHRACVLHELRTAELERAMKTFVKTNGQLTMHVAVETEYRFAKGERQQVLAGLTAKGNASYARALILKAQAN